MIGIIISGHGKFASGISAALELIMGQQESYEVIDFPYGDTIHELETNVRQAIEKLNDCENILVFTDLLSGSPFNVISMESLKDSRIKVIYGTNLGMLVESVLKRNMDVPFEQIVVEAIETGKQQIGLFQVIENDDEFDD